MKYNKAIIVFEDNTSLWYLKVLKKNFRHCYLLLVSDITHTCLELNPMSNKIFIHSFHKIGLKSFLYNKLYVVVDATFVPSYALPVGFFTCVEVVKRVVGINNRFIITPNQLYTYLKKIGKKSLTFEKNCFIPKLGRGD